MMRAAFTLVAALLLAVGSAGANSFFEMPDEFRVPVPDGWSVSDDTTQFPIHLIHDSLAAQLSIFKTELSGSDQLRSQEAFRESVSGVIDSVVLQLPDAVLLTSTGYNVGNRAEFVVEFSSTEPNTDVTLRHYLVGLLYRHPDGYQVMFSLWGRSAESQYARVKPDFEQMREGFRYLGPAELEVFPPESHTNRWLLLLLVGMIAILFLVRRRRVLSSRPSVGTVPIWRCSCGRANHIDNAVCRRCGAPRPDRIR